MGDCYFLSVLACLAQQPDRIHRLFVTKEENRNGYYAMRICKNGIWQDVVVDDMIPCPVGSHAPAFSQTKGNELWVILLEKAWAKLHSSYRAIEAGSPSNVMRDLTGAPSYKVKMEDKGVWAMCQEAQAKGWLMACSTHTKSKASVFADTGLRTEHSYTIIAVHELKIGDHKRVRLFHIRNPWGKLEWTGDWSDSSQLWTS